MKKMKSILTLLLAVVLCLSVFAACGGGNDDKTPEDSKQPETSAPADGGQADSESDLAYIKEKGKLTIGYTVYEPMNYTDADGNFTGFDTELATMVCEKLGVEPEFAKINWDTKEIELAGKTIDVIWNGMTLDSEREANMACTIPYCKNAQVVVMKAGAEYTDTASLAGKVVCAEQGSAGEKQILGSEEDEVTADPGLAQAEYVAKSVQTDCLLEVKAGTADAAVLDMTLANAMTGEGTDYADLVIVDYLAEENYGAAFRKGSDVRDAVNEILQQFMSDGTLQQLADKYSLEIPA